MFEPFSNRAKTWEPIARELRALVGLNTTARLDPWLLAPRVGLAVVDASRFTSELDKADRQHLTVVAQSKWSGGVLPIPLPDGSHLCILNPAHSKRRNKVTLMEEIAHSFLRHKPSRIVLSDNGLTVRDFDHAQEAEAYGVGTAALLPWAHFFPLVNSGASALDLVDEFDVTRELIEYRIKIAGAYKLYCARQQSRS